MTTFFPKPLDKQVAAISDSLSQTQDGLAIVANGNTHAAISSGQFVYVKGHDTLSEGLYKATSAIDTNGTLSTSNLTPDGSGGLNDLQGQLTTLNSNITWKLLEAIANTNITIPNGFNEAIIHVLIEANAERTITFSIAKNLLAPGTSRALRSGYYENNGNNAYINVAVRLNTDGTCIVNASKVVLSGTDVTSTSYVKIAYR